MTRLAKWFASILIFLLGTGILIVLSLFLLAAFCVTYPVLRLSPRDARLKAGMDLALAVATMIAVAKPDMSVYTPRREQEPTTEEEHDARGASLQ